MSGRAANLVVVLRAFLAARWRMARLADRDALARYQGRRLRALVDHATTVFPFYRPYRGQDFDALPVIDKAAMLAHFAGMNVAGLGAEAVRAALERGEERLGGLVIGRSTGTSGNRGYYVITEAERFVWLGTLLAKALPDALLRRHRVALAMPGLSALYRSASAASRIELAFFDLARGVDAFADALVAFAPDTIVAPPKVLRRLAERGQLTARRVFSGAEVLDPIDRDVVEAATGTPVREIYMATEGLFGVGCRHGRLHLAEDVVRVDLEPVAGSPLLSPVVTDFTRRAQAMIRYRMNDLVEGDDRPCPCGSPFRTLARIVGRKDDCLRLEGADGRPRFVTPDVVRNAVVDADPAIRDFRVVQTGPATIDLHLDAMLAPEVAARAAAGLAGALARIGAAPQITPRAGLALPFDTKLRRVCRAPGSEP